MTRGKRREDQGQRNSHRTQTIQGILVAIRRLHSLSLLHTRMHAPMHARTYARMHARMHTNLPCRVEFNFLLENKEKLISI